MLSLDVSPLNFVSGLVLRPSFRQCRWIFHGRVYYTQMTENFLPRKAAGHLHRWSSLTFRLVRPKLAIQLSDIRVSGPASLRRNRNQSFCRNVNATLRSSRTFSFNQKISSVPLSLVSPGIRPDTAASKILCS